MMIETGIQYTLMIAAIILFATGIPFALILGDKYTSPLLAGLTILVWWGGAVIIGQVILLGVR